MVGRIVSLILLGSALVNGCTPQKSVDMEKSAGPSHFDGDAVLLKVANLAEFNEIPARFTIEPSSSNTAVVLTEQSNGNSLGSVNVYTESTAHISSWNSQHWRSPCDAKQRAMLTKGFRNIAATKIGQVYFISVIVTEKTANIDVRCSPPQPGAHKTFVLDRSGSIVRVVGGR